MGIDVLGRYFNRAKIPSRGPPGIGFKFTTDGHYDIEKKKANIAFLRTEVFSNNRTIGTLEISTNKSSNILKVDTESN